MWIKIVGGICVLIAGVLIYAGMQPAEYMVAREMIVKASADAIFPYINTAQKTEQWMPWNEADPNMKMNYTGPTEGVGATSSWDSTGQMGSGQAVVVESVPNQVVKTQLTYTKPMEMSQLAEISLTPLPDGTMVRWAVSGKNSLMGRVMCVFMNMDKMVGGEFEKGLSKLKGLVETQQTMVK